MTEPMDTESVCRILKKLRDIIEQFPEGQEIRYEIPGYFRNVPDALMQEMGVKQLANVYKVITILRNASEAGAFVYYLRPTRSFDRFYAETCATLISTEAMTLVGKAVSYDKRMYAIIVDGVSLPLAVGRHESTLAESIFVRKIGEPVDWTTLYEEMTGVDPFGLGKTERGKCLVMLRDTKNRLNERVCEFFHTPDKLLAQKEQTFLRNH